MNITENRVPVEKTKLAGLTIHLTPEEVRMIKTNAKLTPVEFGWKIESYTAFDLLDRIRKVEL